ncbi:MAG: hypothetical protein ABIP55_00960, partial [Tepidisphaeraceae bacterium]
MLLGEESEIVLMSRRRNRYAVYQAVGLAVAALSVRPALAQYEAPDVAYAPPPTYYNAATSTDGATLKGQLNTII